MNASSKENIGFPSLGTGLLALFIAGYAWLDGHDFPRVTETWTTTLAAVGVALVLFGLWLTWPRSPS